MTDYVNGANIGDAGDSRETADSLGLNSAGSGSVTGTAGFSTDSDDYYRIVAPWSTSATFTLSGMSADLDLRLFDSTGSQLASSTRSGTSDDSFAYDVSSGSTYYVQVDPYNAAESSYSLSVSLAASQNDFVNGASVGDAGDAANTAASLALNSSGQGSVSGAVGYSADSDDYFRLVAPWSANATITLSGLSADLDLRLYDSAGAQLGSSAAGGTSSDSITYALTSGTTYFVRVDPYTSASSNYALSVSLEAPEGADDSVNGTSIGDAGNSRTSADSVSLDSQGDAVVTGSAGFSGDSDDYYRIDAPWGGSATFSLTGLSEDLDLRLYNSSGSQLASSTRGSTTSDSITYTLSNGGTYYLRVDPYSSASSDYSLTIDLDAPSGASDVINGTTIGDAGNSLSTADVISFDASSDASITGSAGFSSDADDYYRFVSPSNGEATFALSGLSQDLELRLLDAAGTQLLASTASGTADESITHVLTSGSTYYLRVDPFNDSASDYSLEIDLSEPVGSTDYVDGVAVGDAGNQTATAHVVTLDGNGDSAITGSVGFTTDSNDYYRILASTSGEAVFSLSGLEADLDLRLLNSAGSQLARSVNGGTSNDTINYTVTSGSTYYVLVDPYSTASSTYSLSLDLPTSSATGDVVNGVGIGDAGNSRGTAQSVALNGEGDATITGSVGFQSDSDDYYLFQAVASGSANFSLSELAEDLDLRLYDSSGSQLASSTYGGTSNDAITYDVTSGNTYYVRVDPYGSAASDYALAIDLPTSGSVDDTVNGSNIGDAGNTRATADTVTLDSNGEASVTGSTGFSSDSDDYFRVVAPATGSATFNLTGLDEDLDLRLHASDGSALANSITDGTTNESITYSLVSGTAYYLHVDPHNTAASEYALSFDLAIQEGSEDVVNGTLIGDAGGSLTEAASIGLDANGDASVTGSAGYSTDNDDYFRVVASASGEATFSLSGMTSDLDLRLYSSGGTQLGSSTRGGSNNESISYSLTSGNTYYLRVDPYGSASSDYSLTLDLPEGAGASDIINGVTVGDVGNTRTTAATVGLDADGDASISGSVGFSSDSDDFFRVDALSSGTATFTLSGLSEDLDLRLFNSGGSQLSSSTLGGTSNDVITFDVTGGSTYYLAVDPHNTASSTYSLAVDLPAAVAGEQDVVNGSTIGDAGNTTGTAAVFALDASGNGNATGATGFSADAGDVYRIVPDANHELTISLDGLSADLDLYLYSSSESGLNSLGRSLNGGANAEELSLSAKQGVTYYVHVVPYNNASSEYALSVTAEDVDDFASDVSTLGTLNVGDTTNGSVETPMDQDWFAMNLTGGQAYEIRLNGTDAAGSLSDPFIYGVYDAAANKISNTENDDGGSGKNSFVLFTPDSSGVYYLAAGGNLSSTGDYTVSLVQRASNQDDFADNASTAGGVTAGSSVNGNIETSGDRDWFAITLEANKYYQINLEGGTAETGTLSDPYLYGVYDSSSDLIANTSNDDAVGRNSRVTFSPEESGVYYIAAGAYQDNTGSYRLSVTDVTPEPSVPGSGGEFDIQINYSGDPNYLSLFEDAANRWEQIIIGDLPDVTTNSLGVVDDIVIDAHFGTIDGEGNTLAQAWVESFRSDSLIPYHGIMQFDSADTGYMESAGILSEVILHEMGHTLGLSYYFFNRLGLQDGTQYTGQNGLEQYRSLASDSSISFVPMEDEMGPGSRLHHFDEDVFDDELMTPESEGAPGMPISVLTVGVLEDLGYEVNYDQAQAYSLPASSLVAPTTVDWSAESNQGAVVEPTAIVATEQQGAVLQLFENQPVEIGPHVSADRLSGSVYFLNETDARFIDTATGNSIQLSGSFTKDDTVGTAELKGTVESISVVSGINPVLEMSYGEAVPVADVLADFYAPFFARDNTIQLNSVYQANDVIDAGVGTDTAVISGNHADYAITQSTVEAGLAVELVHQTTQERDYLLNFESLQFDDQLVSLAEYGVAVTGQAAFGEMLSIELSGVDDRDINYQWFADGTELVGETAQSLTLGFAEVGKQIHAVASGGQQPDEFMLASSSTAAVTGELPSLLDDDEFLWNSSIQFPNGEVASSAASQLFRTYFGSLLRTPDDGGFNWWLGEIEAGRHDLNSMAGGFIWSAEFLGYVNAPDGNSIANDVFLTHMYQGVFGRAPDGDGYNWWLNELDSGNRSQVNVLVDMTQSNEYVELTMLDAADYLFV